MKSVAKVSLVLIALCGTIAWAQPAPCPSIPPAPPGCVLGTLPGGADSLICFPPPGTWNGDLIIYAHGYTPPRPTPVFQNLCTEDGMSIAAVAQGLGYAFATTTYRDTGLVILEGQLDLLELAAAFRALSPIPPNHTFLIGASEGGAIVTSVMEKNPGFAAGTLALCGPIGNFRKQIEYVGDFRVLFDYFFPRVIPGSAINIPPQVIADWHTVYVPAIAAAVLANPKATSELLATADAAFDPNAPATRLRTVLGVLWYNVFGTNDAVSKLGGNPYGNATRWYHGSSNDFRLNRLVQRVVADPAARIALEQYETTGAVNGAFVTLHTTGDEIVPFRQEVFYLFKVRLSPGASYLPIPILRYGHCNFTIEEVLTAFAAMIRNATGELPNLSLPAD